MWCAPSRISQFEFLLPCSGSTQDVDKCPTSRRGIRTRLRKEAGCIFRYGIIKADIGQNNARLEATNSYNGCSRDVIRPRSECWVWILRIHTAKMMPLAAFSRLYLWYQQRLLGSSLLWSLSLASNRLYRVPKSLVQQATLLEKFRNPFLTGVDQVWMTTRAREDDKPVCTG